jgi:hypothetical protein
VADLRNSAHITAHALRLIGAGPFDREVCPACGGLLNERAGPIPT